MFGARLFEAKVRPPHSNATLASGARVELQTSGHGTANSFICECIIVSLCSQLRLIGLARDAFQAFIFLPFASSGGGGGAATKGLARMQPFRCGAACNPLKRLCKHGPSRQACRCNGGGGDAKLSWARVAPIRADGAKNATDRPTDRPTPTRSAPEAPQHKHVRVGATSGAAQRLSLKRPMQICNPKV